MVLSAPLYASIERMTKACMLKLITDTLV